ncbi:ModD protein [Mangrovicoccus sp. HB161399]|uniref:ModD protein n=1 Tax=Mangrovicoccus sp. HB161399 TaxID=2720392 RepID=UPI0015563E4B|nr:ModD protein [Mangrovicoccus sp. HB161399]
MFHIPDETLAAMIREDLPFGDLTTRSLGLSGSARLEMRARADMTACATEEAARIFRMLGAEAAVLVPSGGQAPAGTPLLRAAGGAEAILAGWKVAQTLAEWASGIATAARAIVDAAEAVRSGIAVACTRKPVPGTRALSLKAVTSGGAAIHRTGLSDTVLLFPEHCALGGEGALAVQVAQLRASCPEKRIVVEVGSRRDALIAARHGADVIQLEKFLPEDVAAAARALAPQWSGTLAAAGGIHAGNAAAYAESGADVLVTSSPYSAKPAEIAVSIARP